MKLKLPLKAGLASQGSMGWNVYLRDAEGNVVAKVIGTTKQEAHERAKQLVELTKPAESENE
jgi:hypothetical protein